MLPNNYHSFREIMKCPTFCSDFVKLPYRPTDQDNRLKCPTCRAYALRLATLVCPSEASDDENDEGENEDGV